MRSGIGKGVIENSREKMGALGDLPEKNQNRAFLNNISREIL